MSITKQNPRTIRLSGPDAHGYVLVNDIASSEAITPGHLVEYVSSTGLKWRKHATAGGYGKPSFALEPNMLNKDIDTAYASGDLIEVVVATRGSTIYALLPSGQNITLGNYLESAGDGTLRVYGSGQRIAQALESVNNSAGPTTARIRVECE